MSPCSLRGISRWRLRSRLTVPSARWLRIASPRMWPLSRRPFPQGYIVDYERRRCVVVSDGSETGPVAMVPLTGELSVTVNVSLTSSSASPAIGTTISPEVAPAGIVSVPETGA